MRVQRGMVYRVPPVGREFLVISIDTLTASGTAIVVEVTDDKAWSDSRNLLVIPFDSVDIPDGRSVLAWRINYMRADRLTEQVGAVNEVTLDRVTDAVRAAIEPL